MSSAVANVILLLGLAGIGYYLFVNRDNVSSVIGNIFGVGGGGGGSSGATAAAGKMIYKGTGKVIPGSKWTNKSQACWAMSSGGCRSSSRFQCAEGCCIPYHDLEATVYVHVGPRSAHTKGSARLILTTGGPGQSGNNCCVYSLGFTEQGQAYAEEEGPHSPHPHIYPMPVTGGAVRDIGPIVNRTIGLKNIIWHSGGQTHVEGWVDQKADGNWQLFYRAINPHGGNLPVITHSPMAGSSCQEVRCRVDNYWPITFDTARSFVAELPPNPVPAGGAVPTTPDAAIKAATGGKAPKGSTQKKQVAEAKKSTTKKSNLAYTGEFQYLETPQVSYLYKPY